MPNVLFAGYKVPHPLHPYFLLKIQTDGSGAPAAVLEKACTDLIGTLATLEAKFKREFTMNTVEGGVQEDAYGVPTSGAQWESGGTYVDLGGGRARGRGGRGMGMDEGEGPAGGRGWHMALAEAKRTSSGERRCGRE